MFKSAPQSPKAKQTRAHILATALEAFREEGLEKATVRDIASRAGVSLGSAYYYFEGKEDIVHAYYDWVHQEHARRAEAEMRGVRGLKKRLQVAFHTKLDILERDRRLLIGLFRYGGDPEHRLSWFGPSTRYLREASEDVFEQAIAGESMPDDVRRVVPRALWALQMGLLLYFIHDSSKNQKRTRALADHAIDMVVIAKRVISLPVLRTFRRKLISALEQAQLLTPATK